MVVREFRCAALERYPWLPYVALILFGVIAAFTCVVLTGFHPLTVFVAVVLLLSACVVLCARFISGFDISNRRSKAGFGPLPLFLVLVLAGIGYSVVFTPMSSPDEDYHFAASYEWSNVLLGRPIEEMRAVDVRVLTDSSMSYHLTSETIASADRNYSSFASDEGTSSISEFFLRYAESAKPITGFFPSRGHISIMSSPLQTKLPTALVIACGRLCNLGTLPMFYLGRIANVLFCAAIICVAYSILPYGRVAISALSLMPMTLHEIASYSYDAVTISLAFLLTALLLKAILQDGIIGWTEVAAIVVTAGLLAPCKIVYAVIALAILAVPSSRFSSVWHRFAVCLLVIGIAFFAVGILRFASIESAGESSGIVVASQDGQGGYADIQESQTYSIGWALSHPIEVLILYVNTAVKRFTFLVPTFFGFSLGWFQQGITSPYWLFFLLCLLVVPSFVISDDDDGVPNKGLRAAGVLIFLAGVSLVFASMLFGCTPSGDDVIRGIQGRYFIPYSLLLVVSLRCTILRIKHRLIPTTILGVSMVSIAYLSIVMLKVLSA